MTIDELIEIAHADAKAKGWWDEPRNTGELLMLIVSECGEALEAHRNGKRANVSAFEAHMAKPSSGRPDDEQVKHDYAFRENIKDSFEDELADIVIRIADLMGSRGEKMLILGDVTVGRLESEVPPFTPIPENVGAALLKVVSCLINTRLPEYALPAAIHYVSQICSHHKINIDRHIELKLTYNRTRPHKHGKAY